MNNVFIVFVLIVYAELLLCISIKPPLPVKEKKCADLPGVVFRSTEQYSIFKPPACPSDLGIRFILHRRHEAPVNFTKYEDIKHVVNGNKRLVIIIHGFNTYHSEWQTQMARDIAEKDDYTVFVVNWNALHKYYSQSASDARSVAAFITATLREMLAHSNLDISSTWCIGHSLGAHICGMTGRQVHFGRVTGLDPAGPLYQDDIRRGLNSDSGSFVDVIHTDGWLMGTMNRLGHVDFYPNRGNEQAGCEGGFVCRHGRAVSLFISTIKERLGCCATKSSCYVYFTSLFGCNEYWGYLWNHKPAIMGYNADRGRRQGAFLIATTSESPYC